MQVRSLPNVSDIEILREYATRWTFLAHPGQIPPTDRAWFCYLMRSGRGGGKTRAGSEWVLQRVRQGYKHIALIGQTAADIRDTMVELGPSSIMKIARPEERPIYEPSKRRLTFPNGAVATTFTGEEPDQLRGPAHDTIWIDELAKFKYPEETWDNMEMGLRLGDNPQVFCTTTPRPIPIIKRLIKDPTTIDVRFSTSQNAENLSPIFLKRIQERYAGTRLGRQELEGEVLEDNPNALWQRDVIENLRVSTAPVLVRIVVGVDPAVSSNDESAETGIVVDGIAANGHGYTLADYTIRGSPLEWARAVVRAFNTWKADRVIGEVNNGGDLVEANLRNVDRNIPYKAVHATRGKAIRAEPIAALYEQGKWHHVGAFPQLEDQMCLIGDTFVSTIGGERCIDSITTDDMVWTRKGLSWVLWAGKTRETDTLYLLQLSDNRHLLTTQGHLIYTKNRGFVAVEYLQPGDEFKTWKNTAPASYGEGTIGRSIIKDIIETKEQGDCCIASSGNRHTAPSNPGCSSTIKTGIRSIIRWITSKPSQYRSTNSTTPGDSQSYPQKNEGGEQKNSGKTVNHKKESVGGAGRSLNQQGCGHSIVRDLVVRNSIITEIRLKKPIPVFNLHVGGLPEFYANGVLVHNCDWVPGEPSPDHMDAHVWAAVELMGNTGGHIRATGRVISGART